MPIDLDRIRERLKTPTSGKDLKYMLGDKVKIVLYDDLKNYNTLDELLQPYRQTIILYPLPGSEDVGHWCCVFEQVGNSNNIVQYFDSFGCYPDDNISRVNKENAIEGKSLIDKHLLKLMIESPHEDFHYNDCSFQNRDNPMSNCCGLWCVLRLKNNNLSCEQFEKLFFDLPVQYRIQPDLWCTTLICDMYPEIK